jgi:hypothetical protein
MPVPSPAEKTLDREFLGLRCRLIDLAATLDRIDRTDAAAADDPRRSQIRSSLEILMVQPSDRAEQVQLLFSRRD